MQVVEVIPVARGVFAERLSYFAKEPPPLGSLVSIPLRKKKVLGLVVALKDVRESKGEIKDESFSLRKLGKIKSQPFLTPAFLKAAERVAAYYVGNLGNVLSTLLPKEVISKAKNKNEEGPKLLNFRGPGAPIPERYVLQGRLRDRIADYKSLIRENFARKKSVFLVFPTIKEAEVITQELSKGIEDYSFIMHRGLSKSEIIRNWEKASVESHPVLIMMTGAFLSLPRKDLGLVIIEREQSRFYRSSVKPYLDVRRFAEFLATELGAKVVFGDTSLRAETIHRHQTGELLPVSSLSLRLVSQASTLIINPKEDMSERKNLEEKERWQPISNAALSILKSGRERGGRTFIFVGRRGLSPLVVCSDCEQVVSCKRCGAPIVLHGGGADPYFLCHRCGEKRGAAERCRSCGSWKLAGFGAGSQAVEELVRKNLPEANVIVIDKDQTPTDKKAAKAAETFYENPGSILIGTEMALFYLNTPVENAGAVAFDSLFAVPDFRMHERVFQLLLEVRERATERFFIESRAEPGRLFSLSGEGNLSEFYREELNLREKLGYPPFKTIIRLSSSGDRPAVARLSAMLEREFSKWNPATFPTLFKDPERKFISHTLLFVDKKTWPEEELAGKLKKLPPSIRVEVDPESVS